MQLINKSSLKLIIFGFSILVGLTFLQLFSQSKAYINGFEGIDNRSQLEEILADCPETIKATYLKQYDDKTKYYYLDGSLILAREPSNDPENPGKPTAFMKCNSIKDIEKLFIRFYGFIISLFGLGLAFSIGRSTVLLLAASDNESETYEKAITSLKDTLTWSVVAFFIYIGITFVLTGILGVGTNKSNEWNLLCQNRIVFDITFGDNSSSCSE